VSQLRLVTTTTLPGAGQQWANLVGVAGVVEHDEHPPVGEETAVEGRLDFQADRDVLGWYAEGVQQPAYRLGRRDRRAARVKAA
jgi:hypothetical protein